jgi:hypothetical protein
MSRSQPRLTSPVTRIFEWSGSKGELTYWDREQSARLPVALPFEFLVLDQLATVTGYSSDANYRIWANEIRPEDLKTEPLTVRTKGQVLYEGLYSKGMGGREFGYTQAIYIAYLNEVSGEYEIGKLMAAGSTRGAWFDFRKTCNVENGKVILTGRGELAKNGATQWYPPVFAWDHSDKQQDDIAIRLDKQLQQYLAGYFKAARTEREESVYVMDDDMQTTTDDRTDLLPPDEVTGDPEFDSLLAAGTNTDIKPEDLPFSPRSDKEGGA